MAIYQCKSALSTVQPSPIAGEYKISFCWYQRQNHLAISILELARSYLLNRASFTRLWHKKLLFPHQFLLYHVSSLQYASSHIPDRWFANINWRSTPGWFKLILLYSPDTEYLVPDTVADIAVAVITDVRCQNAITLVVLEVVMCANTGKYSV